jgi:hypothetical protein
MTRTVVPIDLSTIPPTPAGVVVSQEGSIVAIDVPVLTFFHRVPALAVGLLVLAAFFLLSRSLLLGLLCVAPIAHAWATSMWNRILLTISPAGVTVVERGPVFPRATRSFSRDDLAKLTLHTVTRRGLEEQCSLAAAGRVIVRVPSIPATFIAAHIKHGVGT